MCLESTILIHQGKVVNTQKSRKVHEAIVVWSLAMLHQRIQKQALSASQGKEKNTKWSTIEMG